MTAGNVREPAKGKRDVSVLIVDDQPFFRGAARDVLGALPGFHAVAEATSGREAVAAVRELRPELGRGARRACGTQRRVPAPP